MYFILGIVLLSLTHYSALSTNWREAKVEIPRQIPRRWFGYSAVIIAILGFLIFWLPTNYGMGFFDTFMAVFGFVYEIIATVYAFIFFLFRIISSLLFHPATSQLPIVPPAPTPEAFTPAAPSGINWTLIKSIIFWVGLVVLVVVALRQFILFNKDLAGELKRFRPLRWLALFWKRVTGSVKKANQAVGIFVQSSLKRLRALGRTPTNLSDWEYINPRRLDPRQKIIFYYLALLRRAGEAGLPRQDGQTPYEYARSLPPTLAEAKDGVEDLTGSFVEARYSVHDIPANEASRVETLWETVRRILRSVRKSKRAEEKKAEEE
jgi:hypothetical protein